MGRKEDDQEQWEWFQEWRRTHRRWVVKVLYHSREFTYLIKVMYFNKKWTAEVCATWMRLRYPRCVVEVEQEKL